MVGERRVRIIRDDTGAILVIGVFAAVFLVGVLFYVVGIGESVLRREALGDSADAVSMVAAVVHARTMNLIVLLNQIMAALLAVLVALRLVEMLATLAIFILLAAAFFGGEAGLAAVPGLQTVRQGARNAYEALDEPVHAALRALNGVEHAVSTAAPALAELEAAAMPAEADPRAQPLTGFVVPPRLTLPVEDDAFDVLCDHAGKDAASVAMLPLSPFLPGISGEVEDALGDLAGSASSWFCGKSDGKPPAIHRTVKRVLPTLGVRARCEASTAGNAAGPSASSPDCAEIPAVEAASEPDSNGGCQGECGEGGPFEERVQKAREQCNPGKRSGLRGFSWQERKAHVEYANRGSGWMPTGQRTDELPRLVSNDDASFVYPCGTPQALYSPDFAPTVHPSPHDPTVVPVCTTPIVFPVHSGSGVISIEVTEVLQILRCVVSEERTIDGNFKDSARAGDASAEAPARVLPDAALGEEMFQLRGVVLAGAPATYVDRIVETAAWGTRVANPAAAISQLGGVSLAQAEYYFDHDGSSPREEWMWSRRWTARLRRLRVPTDGSSLGFTSTLFEKGGPLSTLRDLSSH